MDEKERIIMQVDDDLVKSVHQKPTWWQAATIISFVIPRNMMTVEEKTIQMEEQHKRGEKQDLHSNFVIQLKILPESYYIITRESRYKLSSRLSMFSDLLYFACM